MTTCSAVVYSIEKQLQKSRPYGRAAGRSVLQPAQKMLPSMKSMASSNPHQTPSSPADGALQGTVPVIEETAHVQVVEVDQGGWRITKKVQVTDQQIDEELQNFSVQIERRPMGMQLEGSDVPQARYEGNTLVIPVVEEVLVTEKRLVLVEEVRITSVHGTHRTPQQVSLRKETVSVERMAPEPEQPGEPTNPSHQQLPALD